MAKGKKDFGDDLIGAYATAENPTEEFNEYIQNIDNQHNIYKVDNQYTVKKRGRPKVTGRETRSKNFNLLMKPSTFDGLGRLAALQWAETGKKTSVTDLVNTILENYLVEHGGEHE